MSHNIIHIHIIHQSHLTSGPSLKQTSGKLSIGQLGYIRLLLPNQPTLDKDGDRYFIISNTMGLYPNTLTLVTGPARAGTQ